MKRSDITRELGFIDPEFIAEAASYKPQKISKIRIVALAACIAVLVTAIPLSLIMNLEDPVQTPDTTLTPGKDSTTDTVIVDPKPLKVIYCDASEVSPQYLEANLFKDKNSMQCSKTQIYRQVHPLFTLFLSFSRKKTLKGLQIQINIVPLQRF